METIRIWVSIPSRGFWFFEVIFFTMKESIISKCFNPLAGILVF